MIGETVHSDLKDLYLRYMFLATGLVLTSVLPALTFFAFYGSPAGLAHLAKNQLLLKAMTAFILQIPLFLLMAYFLAVKRMKFLQRSSELVKSGVKQDLLMTGAYKVSQKGGGTNCVLDLAVGDAVERFEVIPIDSIKGCVSEMPELPLIPITHEGAEAPEPERSGNETTVTIPAFIDPETKQPVAVEYGGNVLWICPPAKMF
jgi:hypothetical protein